MQALTKALATDAKDVVQARHLQAPLLLLWGESDPWIVSSIGDRYEACARRLGKDVRRVSVNAGHCPQDEDPAAVNAALLAFAAELTGAPAAPVAAEDEADAEQYGI